MKGLYGKFIIHTGDISIYEDVISAVTETKQKFGRFDALVNNATIIGPPRFIEDAMPSRWKQTLDVNLNGAMLVTRAVLPDMMENQSGKIINIASGLGRMPYPRFCAYAVSKAGLIHLTRSLSEELKPLNIQVNAVDTSVMNTHAERDPVHGFQYSGWSSLQLYEELKGRRYFERSHEGR